VTVAGEVFRLVGVAQVIEAVEAIEVVGLTEVVEVDRDEDEAAPWKWRYSRK
jgi:hypothetical protein